MDEKKVVIELDNVKRDFLVGDETVHALRGVSFKIYEGEFVNVWENETNEIMSLIDDFEKSPNIPLNINVKKKRKNLN